MAVLLMLIIVSILVVGTPTTEESESQVIKVITDDIKEVPQNNGDFSCISHGLSHYPFISTLVRLLQHHLNSYQNKTIYDKERKNSFLSSLDHPTSVPSSFT